MTLKWGSTTVTAVKWGSTNCTQVKWGSTVIWPDSPFAVLTDIWSEYLAYYHSGSTSNKSYTTTNGAYSGYTSFSGKTITCTGHYRTSTNTRCACGFLLTSYPLYINKTITATFSVTKAARYTLVAIFHSTSKPVVRSQSTSYNFHVQTGSGTGSNKTEGNVTYTSISTSISSATTYTVQKALSGTYYIGAGLIETAVGGNITATITGLS